MFRRSILGVLTIAAGVGAALAVKYLTDTENKLDNDEDRDLFDGDDICHRHRSQIEGPAERVGKNQMNIVLIGRVKDKEPDQSDAADRKDTDQSRQIRMKKKKRKKLKKN